MGRPTPHKRQMTGFDPPNAHQQEAAVRCIIEYNAAPDPPLLRLFIHGAPHRRVHQAVLRQYRKELWEAAKSANVSLPIRHHVELTVTFTNPTGPDLDNLLTALFQALDGKCGKGPTILTDDRLICFVKMGIMFS